MTHNPHIQAAIFDLGGVIIDICPEAIPRNWAHALGTGAEEIIDPFRQDRRFEAMERGQMDIHDYHAHAVELIGRPLTFEDFLTGWNSLLKGPMPGIEPLLAELARHLRLVVLTNTNSAHDAVWRSRLADALQHFERVFVSYEMNARKPEPACFQQVLDYLALDPAAVVMVDDSPDNIAVAREMGMQTILAAGADQIARQFARLGVTLNGE